jgi:predicted adenine nucleotide alpha hydrolase (AANH) superfamily ATPase
MPITRVWNHLKREKYIIVNKAERSLRCEECFDINHEDAKFRVCPAG